MTPSSDSTTRPLAVDALTFGEMAVLVELILLVCVDHPDAIPETGARLASVWIANAPLL